VGNISTSRAYRDETSNSVRVSLSPRFALLGGWKSNWQIGYNFNTDDGYLFQEGSQFELRNIKLQYALDKLISESYSIKVVLPEGSTNVRIRIGEEDYDMRLVVEETTEGYLDFEGRPTFVIANYRGNFKDKEIQVFYENGVTVYKKPIILFVIVVAFLLLSVFAKRFQLQAFEHSGKQE
jgi:oligosaccharyltransferase complex subunit alpha (ribophorin I)